MMREIANDFATVIRAETGAETEFTMIDGEHFSIFTTDMARFVSVVEFVKKLARLQTATVLDDMCCAFFEMA